MSDNHYDTPESIFTIPDDVDEMGRSDLIAYTMQRIKATIVMVSVASRAGDEVYIPDTAISDCLWGVYGQLEQLEKLIDFEVKEANHD